TTWLPRSRRRSETSIAFAHYHTAARDDRSISFSDLPMLNDVQRDQLGVWAAAVLPRAVAYARSLLRDRSQADDVVQECLYRLLRRADEYDLLRDGVKLLFRAVSNLCINKTVRDRSLASLDTGGSEEGSIELEDRLTPMPDAILQQRELQDAIAE